MFTFNLWKVLNRLKSQFYVYGIKIHNPKCRKMSPALIFIHLYFNLTLPCKPVNNTRQICFQLRLQKATSRNIDFARNFTEFKAQMSATQLVNKSCIHGFINRQVLYKLWPKVLFRIVFEMPIRQGNYKWNKEIVDI